MGLFDKLFNKNKSTSTPPVQEPVTSFDPDTALLVVALRNEQELQGSAFDRNEFADTFAEDFPVWSKEEFKRRIDRALPQSRDYAVVKSCAVITRGILFDRKRSALLSPTFYSVQQKYNPGYSYLRENVLKLCQASFTPNEQPHIEAFFSEKQLEIREAVEGALSQHNPRFIDPSFAKEQLRIDETPTNRDTVQFLLRQNQEGNWEGVSLKHEGFIVIPVWNMMLDYWDITAEEAWQLAEFNTRTKKSSSDEFIESLVSKTQVLAARKVHSFMQEDQTITQQNQSVYEPFNEPQEIRKRIVPFFTKLRDLYPDMIVTNLNRDHKKLGERASEVYRLLGYQDISSMLKAYGFTYVMGKNGRPETDKFALIDELKRRYPDGPQFTSVKGLMDANADLKFSTLSTYLSKKTDQTMADILIQHGLITDSNAEPDDWNEYIKETALQVENKFGTGEVTLSSLFADNQLRKSVTIIKNNPEALALFKEVLYTKGIQIKSQKSVSSDISENDFNEFIDLLKREYKNPIPSCQTLYDNSEHGEMAKRCEKFCKTQYNQSFRTFLESAGIIKSTESKLAVKKQKVEDWKMEVEYHAESILFWLLMKLENIKSEKSAFYSEDGKKFSPKMTLNLMTDFINVCSYVSEPANRNLLIDRAVKRNDGALFTNRVEYFCHSGLHEKVKSDFSGIFYYEPFALRIKNWTSEKMEVYLDSYESKFNAPTASEYVAQHKEAVNQYLLGRNNHFDKAKEVAEIFVRQFKYSFEEYAQGATFRFWKYIVIEKYINDEKIVHIPWKYDGIGTSISSGAFADKNITEIHMDGKIGDIEDNAFANCRKLEKFYLPESIENISENAFLNCNHFVMISSNKRLKPIEDFSKTDLPGIIGTKQYSNLNSICNHKFGENGKSHKKINKSIFEEWEVSTAGEKKLDSSVLLAATFCYEPFELPSRDEWPAKYQTAWNELFSAAIAIDSLTIIEKLAPFILTSRNIKKFIEQAKSTGRPEIQKYLETK